MREPYVNEDLIRDWVSGSEEVQTLRASHKELLETLEEFLFGRPNQHRALQAIKQARRLGQ